MAVRLGDVRFTRTRTPERSTSLLSRDSQMWTALSGHGLPSQPGRIGIAVSPSKPQRVYALIDAVEGGLYRSDDRAASWTRVSNDSRIWKRGWYFAGVTVDPTNADVVYICNTAMYRSVDGADAAATAEQATTVGRNGAHHPLIHQQFYTVAPAQKS
jgi:hypothetical protein